MKNFTWLLVGAGVAAAVYFLVNQPGPQYATGSDDVEDAADRASLWGSKQRLSGVGGSIGGKLKEGFGRVTGDDQLAGEGLVDQVGGAVKDTAGRVAQAAGDALHELNR